MRRMDLMQRATLYLAAVVGGAAFLFMVKLMYDMTVNMALMTQHVGAMATELVRMRGQMGTLVRQVAGIEKSVGQVSAMAADVRGMRESMQGMAGVIDKGGWQIERLNPMEMMQQVVPPRQGR
jgi:hypothetical protein